MVLEYGIPGLRVTVAADAPGARQRANMLTRTRPIANEAAFMTTEARLLSPPY